MTKLCPNCEELLRVADDGTAVCSGCGWEGNVRQGLREPKLPDVTPKLPYVSIDIETTGLDPTTCQTLEVGAVIDDWKSPIDQLPVFRKILVWPTVTGNPYAMALNANLLKRIANPQQTPLFCHPEHLAEQFAQWLAANNIDVGGVQAAGKNFASFDAQFLFRLPNFAKRIKFRHCVLDPAILFWHPLEDEHLPSSKTCYERAGMDGKVAHTAVEDALAVVRLVRIGVKRLAGMS